MSCAFESIWVLDTLAENLVQEFTFLIVIVLYFILYICLKI